MIISVSRRTDIPAFYSEWFYKRLEAKEVLTVNPFNRKQVSRISLKKEDVDCFVFWTKNPKRFMKDIDRLSDYSYYFQFTLTPYGKDVEPLVPEKEEVINTFIELSNKIGKERVIWRYDPILINDSYTIEYHIKWFSKVAYKLSPYTETVVISFINIYQKIKRQAEKLNIFELNTKQIETIAKEFSKIADRHNLKLVTCSEEVNLSKYNVGKSKCIDNDLITRITGKQLNIKKDKNQREECGCVSSVDIGIYNSCLHKCRYCYANYSDKVLEKNVKRHDVNSPIVIGELIGDEIIKDKTRENKQVQLNLFDIKTKP